jgi:predicted Zn-dependent peptidase
MPQRNSAALGIWIGVGGRYEDKADKGIAHLIEHLSFRGSKKYSANKIKETIEGVGGSLNAFTSEEFTCYLAKIIAKHLGLALDVLADIVLEPLLRDEDLEKEKSVILEEIKMYRDLPQSYVNELLDELLWPGHPLGMNLAGTAESVAAFKRTQVTDFQRKFYHPADIVVSAAVDIEHKKIHQLLAEKFAKAKAKARSHFEKVNISQGQPSTRFFYKQTEQSHLAFGYHSYQRSHADRHAVSLLHIILGANMSSRLFNEIREKAGLAYEIGTNHRLFHDAGAFFIHAGVDNRKVVNAVSRIIKETLKIAREPVAKKEFLRAKEYYTGQLLMSLEDTLDHMLWIGEQESALGRIKTAQEILKEIQKVTIEDLLRVAKDILRGSNLSLAIIGPLSSREQSEITRILQ